MDNEYFKGVSVFSVAIIIGLILGLMIAFGGLIRACLLYTSDAADE